MISFFAKKKKGKFIYKGARGIISIFMSIAMLPFLSTAVIFFNAIKYQSEIKLMRELSALSAINTLADYDEYLYKRFGILALDQKKLEDGEYKSYNKNITTNTAGITSGIEVLSGTKAVGQQFSQLTGNLTESYADVTVFENSIMEYAQTNAVYDAAGDVFSVLGNQLSSYIGTKTEAVEKLKKVSDTVDKAEKILDKVTKVVDDVNKLVGYANDAKEFFEKYDEAKKKLEKEVNDNYPDYKSKKETYEKLKAELDAMSSSDKNYSKKQKEVNEAKEDFTKANEKLVEAYTTYCNDLSSAKWSGLVKDLEDLLKKDGTAMTLVKDVKGLLKELGVISDENDDLKNKTADDVKNLLYKKIAETLLENLNDELLGMLMDFEIIQKHKAFIENKLVYNDFIDKLAKNGGSMPSECYIENEKDVREYFNKLGKLNDFEDIMLRACEDDSEEQSFTKLMKTIWNTAKDLFNVEGIYDSALGAVVDENLLYSPLNETPSQHLVNAIKNFMEALESLYNALTSGDNPIKKLKDLVNAIKKLFSGIKELVSVLTTIIEDTFDQILGLIDICTSSNPGADFYSRLLMTYYITNSFACRTDRSGNSMSGTSMTGYKYSSVEFENTQASQMSFFTLIKTLYQLADKSAQKSMFCGAELEYIISGSNVELFNQADMFLRIYLIRLVLNLPAVFADTEIQTLAEASYGIYYIAAVLLEPYLDTLLIVNGGSSFALPIMKIPGKNTCYSSLKGLGLFAYDLLYENVDKSIMKLGEEYYKKANKIEEMGLKHFVQKVDSATFYDPKSGTIMPITYRQYLMIFLFLNLMKSNGKKDTIGRAASLAQLEAQAYYKEKYKYEKNEDGSWYTVSYSLDKAYTAIQMNTEFKLTSLFGSELMDSAYTFNLRSYRGY